MVQERLDYMQSVISRKDSSSKNAAVCRLHFGYRPLAFQFEPGLISIVRGPVLMTDAESSRHEQQKIPKLTG